MKIIILLSVICMNCILCGFETGFKDIDKRAFVVAVGVDKPKEGKNEYSVSLKIAIPSSDASTQDKSYVITEEAKSITEAIRVLKSKTDRELDFGHTKVIIFGSDVVKKDLRKVMDWFMRRRDVQKVAYVAIGKPYAKTVLQVKPKDENIPANSLFLYFGDAGTETPYISTNYLFNFYRSICDRGIDGYLPIIDVHNNSFFINTVSVFKGNKEALILSQDETKTFNAIQSNNKKLDIKVKKGSLSFMVTTQMFKSDFSMKESKKNKPVIQLKTKIKGTVEESTDTLDDKQLEKYGKLASKSSENRIRNLLTKFKDNGVDPFGFGLMYRELQE
ncbi:Ger(x)C family spore germination protein [Bacillus sp. ISL-18]|uniref:Ger(x)C family spore germination protein n=1 Tax=Bacillus sp. ISL-18 TaxID=2819118 RepID=UPI001BEB9C59|nr:Ger(x)C family spore germination protein [Bacillus sp. ISL-18]MBT2659349.1 Ger(x)C family spore germination protein [Bacillus sp. ISL-18]